MHHLVAPVVDFSMYTRCIHANPHLAGADIRKTPCDNTERKAYISVLYNEFIDRIDPAEDGWLIFCHEDFEFLENPVPLLEKAGKENKASLYGVFGARLAQNLRGEVFREHIGEIFDTDKQGNNPHVLGTSFTSGEIVDTLDCQCLMVHSATVRRYGLRFDPELRFNLYVEDMCLATLLEHGLPSRVLRVRCCHHSQLSSVDDRPSFPPDLAVCEAKYRGSGRKASTCNIFNPHDGPPVRSISAFWERRRKDGADIYQKAVAATNRNLPIVLFADMMRPGTAVLDVGCASGDNGVFLKQKLAVSLWGLDYNPVSVERAKGTGVYEEALSFDLDNFHLSDLSRFYGFFDHILLGDVLEHITDPLRALKKLTPLLAPDSSFLVSLPNAAHAAVITNLLDGDFQYGEWGILDATHLRFFARKSLAALFANAGLAVMRATATFLMPDESPVVRISKQRWHSLWRTSPPDDRHFLVCQYVSELRPWRSGPSADLARHNLEQIDKAPENNPAGWETKQKALERFLTAVRLSCDSIYPEDLARTVWELTQEDKMVDAIYASGLFDTLWYVQTYYPEAALHPDAQPPLAHFIETGWRKGYNPSEHFDTAWYLSAYPAVAQANICPLLHYLALGMVRGYARNPQVARIDDAEMAGYARRVIAEHKAGGGDENLFVPCAEEPYHAEKGDTKLVAFYLPQFYPFPENDAWWGKGFTEWSNVSNALPQYAGHYQPHLPLEGFYDLRLEETVRRQIELARLYGIYGFCYHYYWFSGKKLMEMPIERLLKKPELDFPFCLCWANEPWSARWDGSDNELLIGQNPAWDAGDAAKFFADILPLLADPRYIRVNGTPMLIVYRPLYFTRERFRRGMDTLRELAVKHGLGGLHIVFAVTHVKADDYFPEEWGGDAFVEFLPHRTAYYPLVKRICNPRFDGRIFDARQVTEHYKAAPPPEAPTYRTVFPMWDNTARKAETGAVIFENTSPEWYRDWLEYALAATRKHPDPARDFVFINAWNEWGEGAHLEPDRRYGFAFLEATKQALYASRQGAA